MKLYDDVRALGGLASLGELLDRGHWREWIDIAVMYRKLIRVRKGWYALADEAEAVIASTLSTSKSRRMPLAYDPRTTRSDV